MPSHAVKPNGLISQRSPASSVEQRGRGRTWSLLKWACTVATALFILSLSTVFILGAVRFAFSWQPVYSYAVTAYHADESTGVATPELLRATGAIRNYFTNAARDLDVTVVDGAGQVLPLFSDKEIGHMRDVKALVGRIYFVLILAFAYCAVYAVAGLSRRLDGARQLARATLAGSLAGVGVLLALGAAVLLGFDQVFLEFHMLSFSNNLWELDPTRDHLVQIFPQGFWFDMTVFVGLVALVAAAIAAAISGTYLLFGRTSKRPDS